MKELARFLIDLWHPLLFIFLHLPLFSNLLFESLLLEEPFLICYERVNIANTINIVVMSRLVGPRAALIFLLLPSSWPHPPWIRVLVSGRRRSLSVEFGSKTALLHFFPFLLKLSHPYFLLLLPLLFGVLLLPLFDVEDDLVLFLELVDHHVFLGNQQVRPLLVVELLDQLVVRLIEVLGSFDRVLGHLVFVVLKVFISLDWLVLVSLSILWWLGIL